MPQVSAGPGKIRDMWRRSNSNPQVGAKLTAKPLSTHRCVSGKKKLCVDFH